jgi:hypothetical protein
MKVKSWCFLAVACLALLVWSPATAAEDLVITVDPDEESADSCLDYTPVDGVELEPALLLGIEGEAVAPKPKPCRQACPDQPWCECTYQGHPRVSCDPCCYQTYIGLICTS